MSGVLRGSLVALVTPMTSDGRIDSVGYERLLAFHLDQGTQALVIGGTTGESPTLTPQELEQLVVSAVAFVKGRIPVIAGSGTNNTATSIELTRRVAGAGADACLVVTPYYNKPTQTGLRRHFEAIADASDIPLMLYNVPGRTGTDLLPDTVRLLAAHESIVALKEATGSVARAQEIIDGCAGSLDLFSGDDPSALELMRAGAVGVVSVTANVVPAAMAALCDAAMAGDFEQASRLDQSLTELHRALFIEPNPIPVKYALEQMGLISGMLRLPLTPLSPEYEAAVIKALRGAGLEV